MTHNWRIIRLFFALSSFFLRYRPNYRRLVSKLSVPFPYLFDTWQKERFSVSNVRVTLCFHGFCPIWVIQKVSNVIFVSSTKEVLTGAPQGQIMQDFLDSSKMTSGTDANISVPILEVMYSCNYFRKNPIIILSKRRFGDVMSRHF